MDIGRRTRLHGWLSSIALTSTLILMIAFAVADTVTPLFVTVIATTILAAGFFFLVFPGSGIFSVTFANGLAIYACVFVYFRESNFGSVHGFVEAGGFILPILAFLASTLMRREEIRAIVTSERLREERNFAHLFLWLLPVGAIGVLTFVVPALPLADEGRNLVFVGAMAAISLIVLGVGRDVCTFLLDTGLLFEDFFRRMQAMIAPAFAFFSFYSVLVILFATLYRNLDRLADTPMFTIAGVARRIGFAESLYFSVITLSTVGYGDIIPRTDVARMLISAEVVLGIVLLLFGFREIVEYTRERRRRDR